jgi:hypothetical protein
MLSVVGRYNRKPISEKFTKHTSNGGKRLDSFSLESILQYRGNTKERTMILLAFGIAVIVLCYVNTVSLSPRVY